MVFVQLNITDSALLKRIEIYKATHGYSSKTDAIINVLSEHLLYIKVDNTLKEKTTKYKGRK